MIIHLVAIILSNLAGFAWLVDIKYVFCSVAKSLIVTEQTPIYKKSFYTEISQIQRIQKRPSA